jgi:hypothetical protein
LTVRAPVLATVQTGVVIHGDIRLISTQVLSFYVCRTPLTP